MNIKQKPANRVHPFPTRKDLQTSLSLPIIATLFLLGSVAIAALTRSGEAWVFCALVAGLYLYLATLWLPDLTGQLRAYREQSWFAANSLTTTAGIARKEMTERNNGDNNYWLLLSFAAQTRAKGNRGIKIYAKVPWELYQNPQVTTQVRYSILDPRIALLEGEAGFTDGIVPPMVNPGS
jgi:hypothetical protein